MSTTVTTHHHRIARPQQLGHLRERVAHASAAEITFGVIRLALGWLFLWAFLDKMFGLGHDTARSAAVIHGGSPTQGFLKFGAVGPLKGFYHSIAGAWWADSLFMLALASIGIALILGIGMRVAAGAGVVLLLMMYSVVLPPANNVFLDEHLVYALALIALVLVNAGRTLGAGTRWEKTALVRKYPWLR